MVRCGKRGQAVVEYVIALAFLLLVAGVVGYLVAAARMSSQRTEALVGSEYP